MADWLKSIQSVGRGFRPGIEIKMISGASDVGKSVILDFESDDFKPFRETFRPHYAEYRDHETGETYWQKFIRLPRSANLYRANNVIRKNDDGSYEYVKNRETGELRKLTEEETMWLILKAGV
jgi:hypothetical protein